MKKLPILLAVLILAASILGLFVACNPTQAQAKTYVAIDINPSIELTLDKNNRVLTVRAMNEDAQVLLYKVSGIQGKHVDQAVEKIAALASEYGYVAQDGVISVTVSSDNVDSEQAIFDQIKASLEGKLSSQNVKAQFASAVNSYQQYKLDQLKAQYPNNADVQALTVGKYRLVKAAMAADRSLTLIEAAAMSNEQLANIVKTTHQYYKDKINDAYEAIYTEAKIAYDTAKSLLLDGLYATVDIADVELTLKGTKYFALRTAYFALLKIEEIDLEVQQYVSQEQVRQACERLQLGATETAEVIKHAVNEYGQATEDSIEYAIERLLANMPADKAEMLEDKFEDVEDYLEDVMEDLSNLSSSVKAEIQTQIGAIKTLINVPAMDEVDDLEDVIEAIEREIESLRKWFDENMTDAQKKTLSNRQAALKNELKVLEEKFSQAISQAKAQAEQWVQERRELRKQQMQNPAN